MSSSDSGVPNIEKLSNDNYGIWVMKMEAVLKLKGVWPAMLDDFSLADAATAAKNKEMDDKARSLIVLGVSDHHLSMLAGCTTARACWDALNTVYRAKTVARRQQLRRDMNRLQKDPRDTIVVYVDKSRRLWQELVATGLDMKESELVWSLLAGLPSEFDTMVEIIEGKYKSDEISLSEVLPQLLQVEQRHAQKEQTNTQALFTRSGGNGGNGGNARTGNNWRSGNGGNSGNFRGGASGIITCYFCGKEGHVQADCAEYKMARDRLRRPTALMATVGGC